MQHAIAEPSVEPGGETELQSNSFQSPAGQSSVTVQTPSTSFVDFMPLPHYSNTNAKRKRKVCHSDVLTSTPYKKQLEIDMTLKTNKQKITAKKPSCLTATNRKEHDHTKEQATIAVEGSKQVNLLRKVEFVQ